MNTSSSAPAASPGLGDRLDMALESALELGDERGLDLEWTRAFHHVADYVRRPAKRVRPQLLAMGYQLASEQAEVPEGVVRFGAGLELLHAFMLVHDDVADRAEVRRGLPALHKVLAPTGPDAARVGEQYAVVAGDHLFALATEQFLASGLPRSPEATAFILRVCRHTAAGQYLDLSLATRPLPAVSLWDALRVATLKTARYGFVAPLVCGAMLGNGDEALIAALSRIGRHAGVAYQLKDDLLGLFGEEQTTGKSGSTDFTEGKRTFPVLAAWTRADAGGRAALERLWTQADRGEAAAREARALIVHHGGVSATERVVARTTRAALKALAALPPSAIRARLEATVSALSTRQS